MKKSLSYSDAVKKMNQTVESTEGMDRFDGSTQLARMFDLPKEETLEDLLVEYVGRVGGKK